MNERLCKSIIEMLIGLVGSGEIKPNDKFFSEYSMADLFNVSRFEIRDVYRRLEVLGILYGKHGSGTYFKGTNSSITYKILFLALLLNSNGIEEIMSVRKIIELGAVTMACENRVDSDIEKLKENLFILENSINPYELSKADTEFHTNIAFASKNKLLNSLTMIFSGYVKEFSSDNWNNIISKNYEEARSKSIFQHSAIVDSIVKRDKDTACKILDLHLEDVIFNLSSNTSALNKYEKH